MYLPIIFIAAALLVFIDVFAVFMLATTLNDAYTDNVQSKAERAMSLFALYINSASATTYNLSTDGLVQTELLDSAGQSLVSKLNDACNYSQRIDGICIYSANGAVYASSDISGQPTLEELQTDEGIAAFIAGDIDSFISFRTNNIATSYHNNLYLEQLGVITCCRKVFDDDGNTIGYIFADILPANIYTYILTRLDLENDVIFISYGDIYFADANNSAYTDLLNGDYGGWFKFEVTSDELPVTLTIFTDNGDYVSMIVTMVSVLAGFSVVLFVLVHFSVKHMAKNFTDRLENLAAKMDSGNIQKDE